MWDFFKSNGNVLLKVALLVFAVMLYMSAAKGISYIMLAFAIIALFIVLQSKLTDRTALYLLLFSISYSIMLLMNGDTVRWPVYLLCPCVFYVFGRYVTTKFNNVALLEFLILTIFLFALRTYIASVVDVLEGGFFNTYRAMNRSGQGDGDLTATLFGLNVSLGFVGLVAYFVKTNYGNRLIKFLLLISFALSLFTVLHLVNRTGLFVFVLCSAAMLLSISVKQGGRILVALLILVGILIVFVPSLRSAFMDISASYQYREEMEYAGGGVMTMGNRLWRWTDAIGRVFTSPFGWEGQTQYNYVHNMWLDAAMFGGFFSFLFMLLATVRGVRYVAILRHLSKNIIVILLIGLTVASFASAFVEPVLIGSDIYFYLMCMFWGIGYQYRINLKNGIS